MLCQYEILYCPKCEVKNFKPKPNVYEENLLETKRLGSFAADA